MTQMLDQIEEETGLFGSIILGGPEPDQGGKIVVMTWAITLLLWDFTYIHSMQVSQWEERGREQLWSGLWHGLETVYRETFCRLLTQVLL
jgi:hypothetical protein